MSDQIYLCVTDNLMQQYYGSETEALKTKALKGVEAADFSKLPFCMLDNRMGRKIRTCFAKAGITPNTYTTSSYVQISTSIGLKGLAACFATRTSLLNQKGDIPEDMNIFPLLEEGVPLIQNISMIHHKERYLSHYCRHFIRLISEYFQRVEQIPIGELVSAHGAAGSIS